MKIDAEDAEIEAKLRAIRAKNIGNSHCLYMEEAWLLIALGRQSEGVAIARQAQHVWQVERKKNPSPYGGSIYWGPWNLEAVVALAEGNWSEAKRCAGRVLSDFEEEQTAGTLYELALHAEGQLHPNRVLRFSDNHAQKLADVDDLRTYALRMVRSI